MPIKRPSAVQMTFERASDTEIPFGPHKGRTLWQVLMDDPEYVDALPDKRLYGELKRAVEVFLAHPDVVRRIDEALF